MAISFAEKTLTIGKLEHLAEHAPALFKEVALAIKNHHADSERRLKAKAAEDAEQRTRDALRIIF
jgi:hypothetical protein